MKMRSSIVVKQDIKLYDRRVYLTHRRWKEQATRVKNIHKRLQYVIIKLILKQFPTLSDSEIQFRCNVSSSQGSANIEVYLMPERNSYFVEGSVTIDRDYTNYSFKIRDRKDEAPAEMVDLMRTLVSDFIHKKQWTREIVRRVKRCTKAIKHQYNISRRERRELDQQNKYKNELKYSLVNEKLIVGNFYMPKNGDNPQVINKVTDKTVMLEDRDGQETRVYKKTMFKNLITKHYYQTPYYLIMNKAELVEFLMEKEAS